MKIILLFTLIFYAATTKAQESINWKNYIMGSAVDSILLLSSNSKKLEMEQTHFSLNNYEEYLQYYEIQKIVTHREKILELVKLFPKLKATYCNTPTYRCCSLFRDAIVFFCKGQAFFLIRISFEIEHFISSPVTNSVNCFGNKAYKQPIINKWIELGLIDIYQRF